MSEASTEPVIRVDELTFTYPTGEQPALADVNLAVPRGAFVGVVGPSGAGKSTLCLCMKGLVPHSVAGTIAGDVTVLGQNVVDEPPGDLAARVALVFQDPEAQIIGLTVAEELAFGPENFEQDVTRIRARSREVLEVVGLEGTLERNTIELSGGQKQRLAIASALMLEPEVMILDEPTSELDPAGKTDVFEVVDRLRTEHDVTIIMVEHDIDRLALMADRLVVLDQGKVVADDTAAELLSDVALFLRTGGERPPAGAELLWRLDRSDPSQKGETVLDLEAVLDLLVSSLEVA